MSNYSQFSYDGLWRNTKIVETTSGSVTSTKLFVWSKDQIRPFLACEERDGTGAVTRKYFSRGQINSATQYFYTRDHLGYERVPAASNINASTEILLLNATKVALDSGSVREFTDNTGVVQAQYAFEPFGRGTLLQGTQDSDFRFAGYYFHNRSALYLTLRRTYSSQMARWQSRDPIYEKGGINLYTYVNNAPLLYVDPSGLGEHCKEWPENAFECAALCAASCAHEKNIFNCFQDCYRICMGWGW